MSELLELAKQGSIKKLKAFLGSVSHGNLDPEELARGLQLCLLKPSAFLTGLTPHPKKARLLLDAGADIHWGDDENTQALAYAAMGGNTRILAAVLDLGAEVNHANINQRTALMEAARFGNTEAAKILLEAGAELDLRNRFGGSAIIEAAAANHPEIVALLAQAGADVNARNEHDGKTPLMYAAEQGAAELVCTLLDRGADMELRTRHGRRTALMAAAASGCAESVQLLLARGADPVVRDAHGGTALRWGASAGPEIVRLLAGVGPAVDEWGNTPLTRAAYNGSIEEAEVLLECGFPIQDEQEGGFSAVQEAIQGEHLSMLRLLLKRPRVELDYRCRKPGWTPLISAARKGLKQFARLLLAQGARVDLGDFQGLTATLHAALEVQVEMLELLVANGGSLKETTKRGESALVLAAGSRASNRDKKRNLDTVRWLLKRGADVDHAEMNGYTALMCAAGVGRDDIVAELIAAAADIDRRSGVGDTALSLAIGYGHYDDRYLRPAVMREDPVAKVVERLLQAGADPELCGRDGPLLELAEHLRCPQVVRMLKRGG